MGLLRLTGIDSPAIGAMGLIWAPTLGVVWQRHRELETQLSGPANPGVDFRTNLNNNLYQHEQRGLGRDG